MSQKPKDILLVKDEKTGEIGVVSGLKKDGTPNLEDARKGNKDFIYFDRGGDVMDNFFKNFLAQCKEPSRFGFYRVAAEGAENVVAALSEMLREPENYLDLLAAHKVDTSKYEPMVAQTEGQKVEEQKAEGQSVEQPKRVYEPIDPERIDWDSLRKSWGISREALEQSGDLQKMLNFGKSDLVAVSSKFGNEQFNVDARLSFRRLEDGSVSVVPHFVRSEPDLKQEFFGHKFTPEDRENLLKTGNMGRAVELQAANGWKSYSYVSVDRLTNDVVATPVNKVRIPEKIGTTELTAEERRELKAGRAVPDKQITLASGRKFTATLQVNADQRGVEFLPRSVRSVKEQQSQGYKWVDESGSIRPPKTLGGVELTPEQQSQFKEGKAILVEGMKRDANAEPYTAYVKFNQELGRPRYYRSDPDVTQSQRQSTEQRVPRRQMQQPRKGLGI